MIARLVLAEKGVQYDSQIVDIHLLQQQNTVAYAKLNPNLTVPTFVNGKKLYSSEDVLLFVDEAFGGVSLRQVDETLMLELIQQHYKIEIENLTMGKFFSSRPRLQKKAIAMLEKTKNELLTLANDHDDVQEPLMHKAQLTERRIKSFSEQAISKTYQNAREMVGDYLKTIEALLGETLFVAGDNYSLADVVATTLLARIEMVNELDLLKDKENVQKYYQRVKSRRSFTEACVWAKFRKLYVFWLLANKLKIMLYGDPFK